MSVHQEDITEGDKRVSSDLLLLLPKTVSPEMGINSDIEGTRECATHPTDPTVSMHPRPYRILSRSISTLLIFGAITHLAQAVTRTWDGGATGTGTDLGTAANWSGDTLPATGDTAQWNGTVAGNLSLTLTSSTVLATTNGIFLDITAAQTGSLQLDNVTTNVSGNSIRLQNVTIASGAGAFTMGNGSGTSVFTLGSGTVTSNTWTNNSSSAATLSSDVIWADGGGVAGRVLTLTGTGDWNMNAVYGVTVTGGTGTLALSKQGTGTLTLSANNTYTAGTTLGTANVAGGVLRVNSNAALGTGGLTIAGGTANDRLEIVNSRTLSNAITLSGRQGTAITAPHIESASGNNTLSGTITFTTGGSNYTIQSDSGSTLTLSNATAITGGATTGARELTLQGAGDGTVSGAIINGTATVAVTKSGTGTWTLSGANTYTGTTTVNAGALITTPAQTGATTVTVADGATFGVKLATAGTTFNVTTLNTGSATGSTLLFDTGALGNPTASVVSTTTFNPVAATVLKLTGTALTVGNNIPLVDYTGSIGGVGFAGLSITLPPRTVGNLVDNTTDTRVDLNITQFEQVKWKGNVNGDWDADTDGTGTNGTQNWVTTVNLTPTKYLQGTGGTDTVNFTDSATGTTNVNIATALTPVGVNFNNSTLNYTFASTGGFGIGGTAALTKGGSGSVTLGTANTYTGGTTLNAGTLVLNHASAIGTAALTINGGALDSTATTVLSTNNALNWNGDFSSTGTTALDMGTGAVTVGGTGTDRTVTVNGSSLTVGEVRSASLGLIKQGSGTLVLTSTGATSAGDGSRVAGVLNAAAGTLQINRTGADSANSGDLTAGGVTGSGTIVNGAAVERWVVSSTTGTQDFTGTLANGGTGGLGFDKQGAGTQTISGANSYTGATTVDGGTLVIKGANSGAGTNATVNAGNLVLANSSALGTASLIRLVGNNVSTLTFGTDGGENVYAFTQGTTTNSTIVSDRATPGAGINHTLTTQSGANGVGGGSITFTSGSNVTSGTAQITFPLFGLGAGSVQTTILNPTTASLSIGDIAKQNNNVSQTIELGGTSVGNEVTGVIANGAPLTGTNNVSVNKSGTSTWTLSGASTYTGATTVTGGTLLVQGTINGSSAVNVNAGTIGGTGSIASALTIGNGTGTQDAILAPGTSIGTFSNTGGVTFQGDAVFALEINTGTLATDLLSSSGAVSLGLGVATLNVSNLGSAVVNNGEVFTFISGTGGVTGTFAGLPDATVFSVGANSFEINYSPTTVELIAVVPEPGSAALLIGGLAGLLGSRRIRRKND